MHVLDRIERKVLLNASRKQVWAALTDAEQFGRWFGIALKGKTFVAGETIEAPITYPDPSPDDADGCTGPGPGGDGSRTVATAATRYRAHP